MEQEVGAGGATAERTRTRVRVRRPRSRGARAGARWSARARRGAGDAVASLRRAWPSLAATAVAASVLVWLAFESGGYFPAAFTTAGAVAFGGLAVLLAVRLPRHAFSTPALVALATLAGLAAWTGLSALWSPAPDDALLDFQRTALYVALFALGLLAAGSGRFAPLVVWAMLLVVAVPVGAGLLSRLQPDLLAGTADVPGLTDFRLSSPFGYWNTFGAMAAMGAVLAAGVAADPRTRVPLRALAAGLALPLAVAMYFSLSRGAWLALGAGILVLVLIGAHRTSLAFTLALIGGAFTIVILRLRGYPALVEDPAAGAGQEAQGDALTSQLLVLMAAVVAVQGLIAAGRASPRLTRAARRVTRPMAVGAGVGLLLVGTVGYAARAADAEGFAAKVMLDVEGWVDEQWAEFMQPANLKQSGTARLTTSRSARSDHWGVAIDSFEAAPLAGEGAGSFEIRWAQRREVEVLDVRDAHSLPFEVMGELGIVGTLLLLGFLAAVVVAAIRSRVRPGALPRSQAAAVAAAFAVWLVSAIGDWHWQMPALSGAALVLAAALFPVGRRRVTRRP